MKKRTKIILYSSIAALLAGVVAWYLFIRDKGDAGKGDGRNGRGGCRQPSWAGCNDSFPIKFGSCGQKVAELQAYINAKENRRVIGIDEKFGCNTLKYAAKYFPGQNLYTDGITVNEFNVINIYFFNL